MGQQISIVIVDDQSVFRHTLRRMVHREGLAVVAEAENGLEALRVVQKQRPDVVLMDISMPVMNGIEATRVISTKYPSTRVIILSMHSDGQIVADACQSGACHFLCKDCSPREIIAAIKGSYMPLANS